MDNIPNGVRRYLDIEAQVDDTNGSDEDDEEGFENFFNDEEQFDSDGSQRRLDHDAPSTTLDTDGEPLDRLGALLTRIHERSQSHPSRIDRIRATKVVDPANTLARLPSADDYPLWRVRCKIGLEEEAVFSLYTSAGNEHQLRSCFTRGSIRGWIYLEATMNRDLQKLLEKGTPGIAVTSQGVRRQLIPFPDSVKMLKMRPTDDIVEEGKWTKVCKGVYSGDIALVVAVKFWGAEVLLVPRFKDSSISCLKRKRTAVITRPALFNPEDFNTTAGRPKRLDNGHYTYLGDIFEYGLIRKRFDFPTLLTTAITAMPSDLFFQFEQSRHPLVRGSTIPPPQEWVFNEHELIVVRSSQKRGTITAIQTMAAEVDLANGEGPVFVPLHDLRKVFVVGNSVTVTGGPFLGNTGLVVSVDSDVACIVDKSCDDGIVYADGSGSFQSLEVHVNVLKIAPTPYLPTVDAISSTDNHTKTRIPWLGVNVTIVKAGPHKGYQAVVKDVLLGQLTSSKLRIEVQFLHLNSSNPFQLLTVDYDDVIESMTRLKLYDYKKSADDRFRPSDYQERWKPRSWALASGGATPLPDFSSSIPAWDPSSRTPIYTPPVAPDLELSLMPLTPAASTSQLADHSLTQPHPLLNRRLIGIKLSVIVNGGKYENKEFDAYIVESNGQLGIRADHYRSSISFEPDWVAPKHPCPKRDKSLLVVIGGDHCGKHVRRIQHRNEAEGIIMILAVIEKESGVDVLSEERLELGPELLCIVVETKAEKKLGNALLSSLREDARRK